MGNYGNHSFSPICLIILIFMLLNIDKLILSDKKNRIYINALLFSSMLGIISNSNIVLFRIMTYFYILSILAIPNILDCIHAKMKIVLYMIRILSLLIITNYQIKSNNGGIIPYNYTLDFNII